MFEIWYIGHDFNVSAIEFPNSETTRLWQLITKL